MYLEVTPKGSKRWRLPYRFDDKEKSISLGIYPEVSVKDARTKREDRRRKPPNCIQSNGRTTVLETYRWQCFGDN